MMLIDVLKMNSKNSSKQENEQKEQENCQTSADSLKVTQLEDGTFSFEWDPNDPKWSWLNDISEDEFTKFVHTAIQQFLDNENV
ncbi:hypothetical protein SWPG_00154 [Synechococcus phage S-CBM2]|nr:hypothetical protein SWPG_00154 [Synechococcus phage S-CBM2]